MSTSTWALELASLERRIVSLEQALESDAEVSLDDPWEPPAAMDGPPTPEQRRRFGDLMARLDACRTGVAQASRALDAHLAEDQQRRAAARRYTQR